MEPDPLDNWVQPEPEIVEFARAMRGMYLALGMAGFTAAESMAIVGQTITAAIQGGMK